MTGNGIGKPVYWKNGKQSLCKILQIQTALCIVYYFVWNDIYTALNSGFTGNTVSYWKNGISVNFPDIHIFGTTAIAISGSDVYAAGIGRNGIGLYWKNNSSATILQSSIEGFTATTSIAVSSNNNV